jgi:dolichyl-diphosphooligosaccharide--protein glycosyltransferase/undecaprenyl-diphosphooligosaccharide--protein glycosyltransferase
VYQFNDISEFKYNNQFMINTHDGYFWAEGAKDITTAIEKENSSSPISSAPSQLTAFLYKYLPFSFETIIFYMPAFFASLIVIPIILIGRSIGKVEIGFIAALLASIAWSYYNRTMVGYYDTDFLNIVFPTILLWSIIYALKTFEEKYLFFIAFDILLYRLWYPQSYSLEFAFFALIVVYLLYTIIKEKKKNSKLLENKKIFYTIQLLSLMLLAMMQLEITLRAMLVVGYFMLFRQERWHKHLYTMFLMIMIMFIASGGLNPIVGQLKGYVFKEAITSSGEDLKLHYYTVMQTIREASLIDINTIANRISGHLIIFFVSILGYFYLCIRHPLMLLALPMLGLGLLSYSGGLRFTIYAVPVLALGVAYLIISLSNKINNRAFKNLFIILSTILILLPNIKHIIAYKIPPVFYKSEVEVLSKIKTLASRDDYVVSWWDYGYPIRYYTNAKTLSDGGKHSGSVNFPTAFAFLSNQNVSAKMLRLDVEYTEKRFDINQEDKDKNRTNIAQMILDYKYKNSNDFLENLDTKINLPKKTRDIYIYLPKRMLDILPTISMFSNIDLMSGKKLQEKFFYKTDMYHEKENKIILGNNISLDKNTGILEFNKQKMTINNFTVSYHDADGNIVKKVQVLDNESPLNIIFLKDYDSFLIVDNEFYNSMYVQLFILENYDKNIYERVISTPLAKVYKLKI